MVILICLCLLTNSSQEPKDKDSEVRRQAAIKQTEAELKEAEAKLARYQKAAVNSITASKGMTVKNGQVYFRSAKEKGEAIEAQKLLVADAQKALAEYRGGKIPPPTFNEFRLPLQTGQFGYLIKDGPVVEVLAVVDKTTIVADVTMHRIYRGTIDKDLIGMEAEKVRTIIRGINTKDLTDGERFGSKLLFEVKGTEKYAGSTMFVLTPISPEDAAKKVAGK